MTPDTAEYRKHMRMLAKYETAILENPDTLEDIPTSDPCAELQSRFQSELLRARTDCRALQLPESIRTLLYEVFDLPV